MPSSQFFTSHGSGKDWSSALHTAMSALHAKLTDAHISPSHLSLGWCYFSDHYANDAAQLFDALHKQLPDVQWTGTVGIGICVDSVKFFDQPALGLMVCNLPAEDYRVFSGRSPLRVTDDFRPATALVHADGRTPDLQDLLKELAGRTESTYLFGGLSASRGMSHQFANAVLDGGGLSGVAFSSRVPVLSRVTQGCQPVGPLRTITAAERNFVLTLDGQPALDCALADLGLAVDLPAVQIAEHLSNYLVGVCHDDEDLSTALGRFGPDTLVRHIVGMDPAKRVLAIAEYASAGMQLAFSRRDPEAALEDLARIAQELKAQLRAHGETAAAALYVSCSGRGGAHFGRPNAEPEIIRQVLGDMPLLGWFAGGEIARDRLYGYTGVLTLFTRFD